MLPEEICFVRGLAPGSLEELTLESNARCELRSRRRTGALEERVDLFRIKVSR
jgi:hypothetical protein